MPIKKVGSKKKEGKARASTKSSSSGSRRTENLENLESTKKEEEEVQQQQQPLHLQDDSGHNKGQKGQEEKEEEEQQQQHSKSMEDPSPHNHHHNPHPHHHPPPTSEISSLAHHEPVSAQVSDTSISGGGAPQRNRDGGVGGGSAAAYPNVAQSTYPEDKHHKTRLVQINQKQTSYFCSNHVTTSKYSVLTFLPFFLYQQFRRYSNIFFLFTAILQQIPDVSPTGKFTTAIPLLVIILVSAVKEVLEDCKRHRADDRTNNQKVELLRDGRFVPITWKEVQVGDFLRLENEQFVPCDLVLYSSSEALGMCYIETANLDGETNLKLRQALPRTSKIVETEGFSQLRGHLECGVPNRQIYEFAGSLNLVEGPAGGGGEVLSLGPDQLVLRGAKLRNTRWVVGQAIYTGNDTKLMMNSTKAPLKRSTLEKATNIQIVILFVALIVMSALSAIMAAIFYSSITYVGADGEDIKKKWLNFLTFIILYNNLIPISLSVTLEVVRFMQSLFISWDDDIYHRASETPAQARTSNLNEELGQIRYIFSDKTGTLTQNIMEFKGCTVSGHLYPYEALFPEGQSPQDNEKSNPLLQDIKKGNLLAEDFLTALAVCHYVIPETKDDGRGGVNLIYNAASPDERALVEGASKFGFIFLSRTPTSVDITVHGERRVYKVLNLIEFTSTRKRMTVVVRCPDGKIRLYCKGADSIILDRTSHGYPGAPEMIKTTQEHLDYFAAEGLRTLCFGMKTMGDKEWEGWNVKFQAAVNSILDREEEVNRVAEFVENNLQLIGATAIEDKLQDNVPETIAAFLEAGISVWVLTGDKQETAINIGNSCRLITPSMTLLIINQKTEDHTLDCILAFAKEMGVDLEGMAKMGQRAFKDILTKHAVVVIDGKTLSHALTDRVRTYFLCLCCSCTAVIVCRAAPMQKAEIVEFVTKLTGAVTLAIGDGANDVAMIQKAHVGVGISGNEGLQAACASDYSIAQFYYLKKLLLVHGAWNHDRITKAIFYSFYKNICLYIIELWFAIYSAWSGQIIYDKWAITSYNLIFVCMQPLVIGIFEQNCSMRLRMKYPKLYHSTSHGAFTVTNFLIWIGNALLHSMILFWLTKDFYGDGTIWVHGAQGSYIILGNSIYTFVVVVVSLKLGLISKAWTVWTHVSIWGSIIMWMLFFIGYSFFWPVGHLIGSDVYGTALQLWSAPIFWISLFVIPAITLVPDILYAAVNSTYYVKDPDIYREQEVINATSFEFDAPSRLKVGGASSKKKLRAGKNRSLGKATPKITLSVMESGPVLRTSTQSLKHGGKSNKQSSESIKTRSKLRQAPGMASGLEVDGAVDTVGPTVLTYFPVKRNVSKRNLGSISHEVDDAEPSTSHTRKPTMMEVILAIHEQHEEERLSMSGPRTTSSNLEETEVSNHPQAGPSVMRYQVKEELDKDKREVEKDEEGNDDGGICSIICHPNL